MVRRMCYGNVKGACRLGKTFTASEPDFQEWEGLPNCFPQVG